ncbi:craniofacial development protein 1-like [Saccostrea cucullata]|uniref:craniofacial development protein 1-like n=1 Tax=Saccostrea cuccullata TaxID=36930 RepID=UPI002ED1CDF5
MCDEEDYSSGSDEDYVPSDGEAVSEEENSGEEEDFDALHKEAEEGETKSGKRKRKNQKGLTARKRKGGIKLEGDTEDTKESEDNYNKVLSEEVKKEQEAKIEEQEKKKADDLWSSFLSDVGSRPKAKPATPSGSSLASMSKPIKSPVTPTSKKVTVTKEFDFAGETVKVTKDIDLNTEEGKKEMKKLTQEKKEPEQKPATPGPTVLGKKPGGLGSVLNKIGKKDKISTLEKSKLDWDSFKQEKGISEELQTHNRGKDGYIERMQFLNRADQRQFEIEKNIRLGLSSKR